MDYGKLLECHVANHADATIGVLRRRREEAARQFGVMEIEANSHVIGFEEKPADPKPVPGDREHCYASMGIYVFTARFLFEELCRDATRRGSRHDFGGDIIPAIIPTNRVFAYPFRDENRKNDAYWRDVGTLDAYYAANMDLISVDPELNMYDEEWSIRTYHPNSPPPKFVFDDANRRGYAVDSIVCLGTIISGGRVARSILGPQTRINSFAQVEESILFGRCDIGRHAKIRRAIIDKDVCVPPGVEVGYDPNLDRARGFTITDNGITVIAKAEGAEHFWHAAKATA
jgi:glucose-1-phosphate adenylyltransferase